MLMLTKMVSPMVPKQELRWLFIVVEIPKGLKKKCWWLPLKISLVLLVVLWDFFLDSHFLHICWKSYKNLYEFKSVFFLAFFKIANCVKVIKRVYKIRRISTPCDLSIKHEKKFQKFTVTTLKISKKSHLNFHFTERILQKFEFSRLK